jgi:hypothetical protein
MIKQLITEFPLSDVPVERSISKEKINKYAYTKEEVDVLIAAAVKEAVDQAREIDEESMAKHNRDATVISMILGFTTLALFGHLDERHFCFYIPHVLCSRVRYDMCIHVYDDEINLIRF